MTPCGELAPAAARRRPCHRPLGHQGPHETAPALEDNCRTFRWTSSKTPMGWWDPESHPVDGCWCEAAYRGRWDLYCPEHGDPRRAVRGYHDGVPFGPGGQGRVIVIEVSDFAPGCYRIVGGKPPRDGN